MADRQKSHFGTDGYRDLEVRKELAKKASGAGKSFGDKIRKKKEQEVRKLRKENMKHKTGG